MTTTLPDAETRRLLAHRFNAVALGRFALNTLIDHHNDEPRFDIYIDGRHLVVGTVATFAGPAIEAGAIHARALLEFLGIRDDTATTVRERNGSRRTDDICIEQFTGRRLTKAEALAVFPGEAREAEEALAGLFHTANKGLAHLTSAFAMGSASSVHLHLGFNLMLALMMMKFYQPLGLEPPADPFVPHPPMPRIFPAPASSPSSPERPAI